MNGNIIGDRNIFLFNREVLGQALGPTAGKYNEMVQWVLKANENEVQRLTLQSLHLDILHTLTGINKRETFDALLKMILGTSITPPNVSTQKDINTCEEYHDEDESPQLIPQIKDAFDEHRQLIYQHPPYDKIINAEVLFQQGDNVPTDKLL